LDSPKTPAIGDHQTRAMLAAWRRDYNEARPHSALKWMTPAAYIIDDGSDQPQTLVMTG
jgi:putative transposase